MRASLVVLFVLGGCLSVDPPIGQFLCDETDVGEDCPDGWICGLDRRCYPDALTCYPHVNEGCAPGQGCYLSPIDGPVCATAGTVPRWGACEFVDDCTPGHVCINGDGGSVCTPFCRREGNGPFCPSESPGCTFIIIENDGTRMVQDPVRICARPE